MPTKDDAWNAKLYDSRHAFVWQAARDLVELLNPREGERIIDLGCGTGHLTAIIASSGAEVVGIDTSEAMIKAAAAQYPAIRFTTGDARTFTVDPPADAVFSNATLHWVRPPEAAAARIAAALKPGGRFVAEFGGAGNVAAIIAAIETAAAQVGAPAGALPWYFPGIAAYSRVLEDQGLEVTNALLFERPTPLDGPDGLRQWIGMFASALLEQIPDNRRDEFLARAETAAQPHLYRHGTWLADYRRIRIVARRP